MDDNEKSLQNEPLNASVAKAVVNAIGTDTRQFREDGVARTFWELSGGKSSTELHSVNMLFRNAIDDAGAERQLPDLKKAVDQLRTQLTAPDLTPAARQYAEATLDAFDQFHTVVSGFRGGRFIGDTENSEPAVVTLGHDTLKKYSFYLDHAEANYGADAFNPDRPRTTHTSNEFRQAAEKMEAEALAKLTAPGASKKDLVNFITATFLSEFAFKASWTEDGKPISPPYKHA
jgi:hypothetical protein